jgi:hypothetical protein
MRALKIHSDPLPAAAPSQRPNGPLRMGLGALVLAIAVYGLLRDIHWVAQPFYAWVWWGYIFVLDGFCVWKRGDSLLTTRLHLLFPICVWSITFWMFFELINSHIQNWYYVGVYPASEFVAGALFTMLAFATVFMGIFQTYDAVTATGLWKRWKGAHRKFPSWLSYALQGIGLAMAGVALLSPHYLAPLIWGSFTLIVDPWNYRRGTRSLLRDLETGDFGILARLLLAGLICGVVWESLNFFAPQKWIYTVRGLEDFKLFEMPLLGFLGFPALALDSMAGFALFASLFLGNRSWERAGDLNYALAIRKPAAARAFWYSCALHMLFWGAVGHYGTPINVASIQLELPHLEMTPPEMAQLHERGITRPRQLLFATDTPEKRAALRAALEWRPGRLAQLRDRAELYAHKGIGFHHGTLLERAGVGSLDDLRRWKPEDLHSRLNEIAEESGHPERMFPPRLDFVRVWILAAQNRGLVLNAGL